MKPKSSLQLAACVLFLFGSAAAQTTAELELPLNDPEHPCITPEEYEQMEQEHVKNMKRFGLDKQTHNKMDISGTLQWPLRRAANMTDCGYYYISAFVDQNAAAGQIQDYNCGNRTYDGHCGVDLVGWPFIWDKMDHDQIEVIAAAPGVITARVDGNPDRICNGVGGGGSSNNYISVVHADGSMAIYAHMKTGSLTTKAVGESVLAGEFLGVVGSAGQSTGPHLHFEIRIDGTFANFVDPFEGNCNSHINSSLWQAQVPYTNPEILKASIHNSWPYMGTCPVTVDTLYEQTTFTIDDNSAFFNVYTKHVIAGDVWSCTILNPDNSVFSSWTYTSLDNRNTSSLGWDKQLPNLPGMYTFQCEFNGSSCSKEFEIVDPSAELFDPELTAIRIFPNPASSAAHVTISGQVGNSELILRDSFGKCIQVYSGISGSDVSISVKDLEAGVYFLEVMQNGKRGKTQKLVITN